MHTGISKRDCRRSKAAIEGAREFAGPIIAITVVLIAVYVPIGFMGGLTGALFTEFAYSLAGRRCRFGCYRSDSVTDDVLEVLKRGRPCRARTGSKNLLTDNLNSYDGHTRNYLPPPSTICR